MPRPKGEHIPCSPFPPIYGGVWCNGNTTGFDPDDVGSIPAIPTKGELWHSSITRILNNCMNTVHKILFKLFIVFSMTFYSIIINLCNIFVSAF